MVVQLIISLVLIASVIFQPAKSQGLSSSIAGAGAQMMGKQNRGYDALLERVTKISAVLFIVLAIVLVAIQ